MPYLPGHCNKTGPRRTSPAGGRTALLFDQYCPAPIFQAHPPPTPPTPPPYPHPPLQQLVSHVPEGSGAQGRFYSWLLLSPLCSAWTLAKDLGDRQGPLRAHAPGGAASAGLVSARRGLSGHPSFIPVGSGCQRGFSWQRPLDSRHLLAGPREPGGH